MTTRIALALGLLASLQPLACSDDDACDYEFPLGLDGEPYEDEVCAFVADVESCVREDESDVDGISDDALRARIEACSAGLKVCADNPNVESLVLPGRTFDEIRGETNDCVG